MGTEIDIFVIDVLRFDCGFIVGSSNFRKRRSPPTPSPDYCVGPLGPGTRYANFGFKSLPSRDCRKRHFPFYKYSIH